MSQYYCLECRHLLGLVLPASPVSLTGTMYQQAVYTKHHAPTGTYDRYSVFDDPTYEKYAGYIVTGSLAGYLEIDYYGRKDLIWYSGERTGAEYRRGVLVAATSGIKIVWVESEAWIHAYPIQATPGLIQYCHTCGKALPMW